MHRLFRIIFFLVGWLLIFIAMAIVYFNVLGLSREKLVRETAAPKTGHFVSVGDVALFVQESGPKNGPAVVLIHAAGGWSEVWRKTMDALAHQGFHAIAIDMPPLGYSERPVDESYDRHHQAQRVIHLLDALQIQSAVIVGHSFGARAAAEAALEAPVRVRAFVLVDAAISFASSTPRDAFIRGALSFSPLSRAITAVTFTNPGFTKKLLQMFVADPASATDEWVGIYQATLPVKGTLSAVAAWLPYLVAEDDHSLSSNPKNYSSITAPALVLWGEKDTTTPLSGGEYLASIIPQAKLTVLKNVGHLPPLEDRDGFNKALLSFLKSL